MRCMHVQNMDHYHRTDKTGSVMADWLRFLPTVMTQLITQYHYGLYNYIPIYGKENMSQYALACISVMPFKNETNSRTQASAAGTHK